VVSVIVVGVLFLAVFPTRTYVAQRGKLASTAERVDVLSEQNERLAARVRKLNTDEELERLAREQYSLVRPGEEAYAILPAPSAKAPEAESAPKDDGDGFWSRLWDDVTFWS
jgi:cell division protein FtsB